MITCRQCETEINQATELCPHCGADLTLPMTGDAEPKKKQNWGKILLRWGLLLAVLLGAMWSFLWFVVTPRAGNRALEAQTQAVLAIEQVRGAIDAYAGAQNGSYPENLEVLGNAARQAAQMAQSGGYHIDYTPGPAAPDGTIHTFTLEGRAGNYGYRNFYTDSSGVVRATTENRPATALDPPIR